MAKTHEHIFRELVSEDANGVLHVRCKCGAIIRLYKAPGGQWRFAA